MNDDGGPSNYILGRSVWAWVVLIAIGTSALYVMLLDLEPLLYVGDRMFLGLYALGAGVAPLFFWRVLRARGSSYDCAIAAAVSLGVSLCLVPALSSMPQI